MSYYCEMCGRELEAREAKRAIVEGTPLILCSSCYQRISRQTIVREYQVTTKQSPRVSYPSRPARSTVRSEEYELVEDYASRIRNAREKLGWSQEILALKAGESVNTIKRIESGKLKPSIPLARKLERILGIRLLEPIVDEVDKSVATSTKNDYTTIGDLIKIDQSDTKKH